MNENPLLLIRQAIERNLNADFRHVQLATRDTDGHPACRTLVFRDLDEDHNQLLFITDFRSHKAAEIEQYPLVEACWYLAGTAEQFRIRGRASLLGAQAPPALAQKRAEAWEHVSSDTRALFAAPSPGTPWQPGHESAPAPACPPDCFALLVLDVDGVDHLQLSTAPHERRLYKRGTDRWEEQRLHP